MSKSSPDSLRQRNKVRIRNQIIQAAIELLAERELADFSADDIAIKAEVGRATFFRYFDSKEAAVVAAFYEQRLAALVDALNAAPAALGPVDAVIWTFKRLEDNFSKQRSMILMQSRMVAASSSLRAKALEYQAFYSQAVADAIAPRYKKLAPHDLRPRLLSITTLTVVTHTIDYWAAGNSILSLPQLMRTSLEQMKNGFADDVEKKTTKSRR
jgi:AcrR family transcriptional regulator